MGGYFPALAVQPPPNVGDQLQRAVQLRSLLGQQQVQQLQIQNMLADQKAYQAANQQWQPNAQGQYDHGDFIDLMRKNGATPQTVLKLQQTQLQMDEQASIARRNNSEAAANQNKVVADRHDKLAGDLDNLLPANTPPEQYEAKRDKQLQQWVQSGQMSAQEASQYANTPQSELEGLQKHLLGLSGFSKHQQQLAEADKARQDAALAKMKAGPIDIDSANQRFTDRWQVLHPNTPLPNAYRLQPGANQLQADKIDKDLQALETASGTQAQRGVTNEMARERLAQGTERIAEEQGTKQTARSDRSYQFNASQLDKVGQPIEQSIQRFGRLQDTINQQTPQADALVAPELLTVMAGGAGSGLRMNEAEISRIVGGRSNFESLKAALNKWQLDPSKALSITPAQRQQIRQLMGEVYGKLQQKQGVLDSARQDLVNEDDPVKHRKIVSDARIKLSQIDMGQGGGTQQQQTAPSRPANATHTGIGSVDKKKHWLDAQGKDLGVAE